MSTYSIKFKDRMVRRMVGPTGASATSLAQEAGVSQSTLSRWLRAASVGEVTDDNDNSEELRERTAMEKAELVFEANRLEGEELGAFLRRHGLHEADLLRWRQWLQGRLDPKEERKQKEALRKQQKKTERHVRGLERELRKKDKALAEAAALLVLKKKFQHLWEDEEDDTTPRSGE